MDLALKLEYFKEPDSKPQWLWIRLWPKIFQGSSCHAKLGKGTSVGAELNDQKNSIMWFQVMKLNAPTLGPASGLRVYGVTGILFALR